jgi:hypothetical protein
MSRVGRLSEFGIASIYRNILREALAAARVSATDLTGVAPTIEKEFVSRVPKTLRPDLLTQDDGPPLRRCLRSQTAGLVVEVCVDLQLHRSDFVDNVIRAARLRML